MIQTTKLMSTKIMDRYLMSLKNIYSSQKISSNKNLYYKKSPILSQNSPNSNKITFKDKINSKPEEIPKYWFQTSK